ncbi:MAG: hypothetical protein JXC85_02880 [Candidatus Aenigmarchaeota archaeon]|nr:hypothetical protein [Candidatus Aenigmarchaeota archaeon]
MNRKKAAIGIFGMVLIGVAILAVMYLVQSSWISKGFKIRADARIFVDVNDESSKILSLLKSKTGDSGLTEMLARELESVPADSAADEITELADQLNIAIVLYGENGKEKKRYGKRVPHEEDMIQMEIALPGGRSALIGIASDFNTGDYGQFSGGGGGGTGGGGAGGGW